MGFLVAKQNNETPEGWVYFKNYEIIGDNKYPMNTIFVEHACVFDTKEAAAKAYWDISQLFFGYKIYTQYELKGKIYGS